MVYIDICTYNIQHTIYSIQCTAYKCMLINKTDHGPCRLKKKRIKVVYGGSKLLYSFNLSQNDFTAKRLKLFGSVQIRASIGSLFQM